MRIRKLTALFGASFISLGCFVLYLMMDFTLFTSDAQERNKWVHIEDIKKSENIKSEIVYKVNSLNLSNPIQKLDFIYSNEDLKCPKLYNIIPNNTVQMLDVYDKLKFDNPDGGVWKQGWNIDYSPNQWNIHNKLIVYVVPHSHNDPGWITTFEQYYKTQTKNILNNMVIKLGEDRRRKFIWAEISFLALWWEEQSQETKEQVKQFIEDGQLEIVTGGWVMNDESNTHYNSIINQMIQGHQWLEANLNYKPKNAWSIDPFGYSPMMAFLFKKMGLENLVIQRVHYSIKKYLAQNKYLEFFWQQLWDWSGSTKLRTHVMPFYSYDIPHTCGPEPAVCCQFDFRRLPGFGMDCPWRTPPKPITPQNVKQKAELLLDQYRKKAQLFQTNVVLVPLGDDFRYDHATEWDAQFHNYQKLFDYMNNDPDMFVRAQFGTLDEFFKELSVNIGHFIRLPTLSGDFFTYADRDDHYWSGYYTSRPFYKRMDRTLMSNLRAAEIWFSLSWGQQFPNGPWSENYNSLLKRLDQARRAHALFQHHDGITGTAKDHVVEDYAHKMINALKACEEVLQFSLNKLLSSGYHHPFELQENIWQLDEVRAHYNTPPTKKLISLELDGGPSTQRVVIANSQLYERKEIVTFHVNSPLIQVRDINGKIIRSQTSPLLNPSGMSSSTRFVLAFEIQILPLALNTYIIAASEPHPMNSEISIRAWNVEGAKFVTNVIPEDFSLSNGQIRASFSEKGLLKAITLPGHSITVPVHLDFIRYGARRGQERSGAYLFLPDGESRSIDIKNPPVFITQGPIFSQVTIYLQQLIHTVTIYNSTDADGLGLEISNLIDITHQTNYELAMRFSTNIKSNDEFYTDLNGYQLIKRKRFKKLPLQANYYPMPTQVFIEDANFRLSVLSAQPLGVASLKSGQIEIMQDRRLNQDDNRGLAQGVLDNVPTPTIFRVLLEKRQINCQSIVDTHPGGLPTAHSILAQDSLAHPPLRFLWTGPEARKPDFSTFNTTEHSQSHDLHLVTLRTLEQSSSAAVGLILHRTQTDTCFANSHNTSFHNNSINVGEIFPSHFGNTMKKSSLTFLYQEKAIPKNHNLPLCPMEINAYVFPK